jgi:glycerophosphoryl diester phosphodiesterase
MSILRIGHRGAKGYVAENTFNSIKKAIQLNVDGIEIDVFKCLSGQLVLSHDEDLKRMTGKSGAIENLTLKEIDDYLINNEYKISTLNEILEQIKDPLLINVELKGSDTATTTSEIINDCLVKGAWNIEHFIVSSFNWVELEKFRFVDKNIPVGILVSQSMSISEAIEFGKKINADAIHPNYNLLDKKTVKKIKNNGFKIFTWTVNDKNDIDLMKELNVDGIISDYPDRI